MDQLDILDKPKVYDSILSRSTEIGFNMSSDLFIGTLLKTLVASKPESRVLEIGTGTGLSLSWMIEGLDNRSSLISLDNDSNLIEIAKSFFENDPRIELVCQDGASWIKNYQGPKFDLIFADAWPGKYSQIVEVLELVKVGGFYIIDDMKKQPNWPEGHEDKVDSLIAYLESRNDFSITKMDWSTGIILMTKKY